MLFWVAGLLGTAYALSIHNLTLLYLFYGIIGGIGLGIGYITPVSTLVKYFPNRPGFATGLAIMGFGFASLIAGPLMQFLVGSGGLVSNFIILGIIYLVVMGASSLYLKAPQPKQPPRTTKDKSTMYVHNHGLLANDAMKTWQFGALWWIFFINITCGIGLLSLASPMAQETIGMTPAAAASLVGIIGIFNGGGRILTAWGLAGIVGPMLVSYFHEAGYGYTTALVCFALLFVLNTIIAIILKIYGKRGLHKRYC